MQPSKGEMSTESSDSGFQMNPTLSLEIDDSNSKESHGENKLEPPATKETFDSGVELSSSDKNADELCKSMGQLKMEPEPTKKTSIWENFFLQNEDGDTYLHWAVINKAIDSVWKMIKVSPRLCLDIQNDFGQTALHIAVLVDQPKVVGWLVAAGASLGIRDAVGNNPLHLACIEGKIACLKELLAANAPIDFEQLNYSGKRCVHIAAEKYNIEILRCLVNAGADINSREGRNGFTPLHIAVRNQNEKVLDFLLEECPELWSEQVTYAGLTAYQFAALWENESIMDKLTDYGAEQLSAPESDDDEEEEEQQQENDE